MTTAERAAAPLLPNIPIRQPDAPGQFAFADRRRVHRVLEQSGWAEIDIPERRAPRLSKGLGLSNSNRSRSSGYGPRRHSSLGRRRRSTSAFVSALLRTWGGVFASLRLDAPARGDSRGTEFVQTAQRQRYNRESPARVSP